METNSTPIRVVDRVSGEPFDEIIAGERALRWVYGSALGKVSLETFVKRRIASWFYGWAMDRSSSRRKIAGFASELGIDLTDAEKSLAEFDSFNDFFARRLRKGARPIVGDEHRASSPGDGRMLVYRAIDAARLVQAKGECFDLAVLLGDGDLAGRYHGGVLVVLRLAPPDYHRFHFPDAGIPGEARRIAGQFYSVNPIALARIPRLYEKNERQITAFESEHFRTVQIIEIGATLVGRIVQTYQPGAPVRKGDEKGYFKFGGSCSMLVFEPGAIELDDDLVRNSEKGAETLVRMGTSIGRVPTGAPR